MPWIAPLGPQPRDQVHDAAPPACRRQVRAEGGGATPRPQGSGAPWAGSNEAGYALNDIEFVAATGKPDIVAVELRLTARRPAARRSVSIGTINPPMASHQKTVSIAFIFPTPKKKDRTSSAFRCQR